MVRLRKYRDKYFDLAEDLASGTKSLQDYLVFLETELETAWDVETRDSIQEQIVKVKEGIKESNRKIIDAQVAFYQKDKTADSLDKAIQVVKEQLSDELVSKNPELRNSYELQLQTLEKEKREVGVEDSMTWMAINLITSEKNNPSLWKLEALAGFRDKASLDAPVNIGGVRYNSEKEYWQSSLNDYIQNSFAKEFVEEEKRKRNQIYGVTGQLPDSYFNTLTATIKSLKQKPELASFQNVLTDAVQGAISNALDYKAKEISAKYYLDQAFAITTDYGKGVKELEKLQVLLGEDYSVTPQIQAVQAKLIGYKYQLTGKVLNTALEYQQQQADKGISISIEEAINTVGPMAEVEIPAKTYLEKAPPEIAKEEVETAKVVPEYQKQIETLQAQIASTQKQIEEAQKAKGIKITTPKVTTPQPTYYTVKSGETLWGIAQSQLGSGARWKELKTPAGIGFTEETAKKLQIGQKLLIPPK